MDISYLGPIQLKAQIYSTLALSTQVDWKVKIKKNRKLKMSVALIYANIFLIGSGPAI